jgi:hypothetical protein
MRDVLVAAMGRHHSARRRRRRAALGATAALLLLGVVLIAMPPAQQPAPIVSETPFHVPPVEPPRVLVEFAHITTDPAVLDRYLVRDSTPRLSVVIGDEELLELLNEIGRPTGLVRAGSRVWLTSSVRDEEVRPPS